MLCEAQSRAAEVDHGASRSRPSQVPAPGVCAWRWPPPARGWCSGIPGCATPSRRRRRTPLKTLLAHAPVARYWEAAPGGKVRCQLCANTCLIPAGDRGRCRARYNDGGVLKSPRLGTTHHHPRRSHREEALLPRPAGRDRVLAGDQRVSVAVQVLPELGDLAGDAGGLRGGRRHAGRPGAGDREQRRAGRRVHLQRADRLRRVPGRHLRGGEGGGAALRAGVVRVHGAGAAARDVRVARRDQDRPQGGGPAVLPPGLRGGAGAGAAQHRGDRARGGPPRDRQPGGPDAERRRAPARRPRVVGRGERRRRRAAALHALPPRLPAAQPAGHAGRDAAAGARTRARPRVALRVRRQRAGRRRQPDLLPGLRGGRHRAQGVLRREHPA